MHPKVSIIIPCFNHAHFLHESVGSVLNQSYTNWECIIVNDGSSDNTEEISNSFCRQDGRIKYIYKENGGLSSARNKGMEYATGEYIQLLDADDVILENKLKIQVSALKENDAEVSICNYKQMKKEGEVFIETAYTSPFFIDKPIDDIILRWEAGLCIPCHTVIFKRKFFSENQILFNTSLPTHEDWAFWVELFLQKPKVVYTDSVLCHYINRSKSMSMNKHLMRFGYLKAADYLLKKVQMDKNTDQLVPKLKHKKTLIKVKYSKHNKYGFYQIKKRVVNRLRLLFSVNPYYLRARTKD